MKNFIILTLLVVSSPVLGECVIEWTPPTQRTDGRVLPASEIKNYIILTGRQTGEYTNEFEVSGTTTSISCNTLGLEFGNNYIAGHTVDTDGAMSAVSNEIVKYINYPPKPMTFTVSGTVTLTPVETE